MKRVALVVDACVRSFEGDGEVGARVRDDECGGAARACASQSRGRLSRDIDVLR